MRNVLALHCMLASGSAWRGLQAALPKVRLTCPDLPGHGRAPEAAGDYMDAALALAMEAAPDGAFDLLGHSYGGCLALRLLAEHPARVRSLTLVEPVMFAAAGTGLRAAEAARMGPFDSALDVGDRDGAARVFTGIWGDGTPWDAMPERVRGAIAARIHLVADSGPGIVDDVHSVLPRMPQDAPPLMIVTRNDPPAIVECIAQGLKARLPNARIERLGRGHMIPMEVPGELGILLSDFWDD